MMIFNSLKLDEINNEKNTRIITLNVKLFDIFVHNTKI